MARTNFIVRGGGDFSNLYRELNAAQKRLNSFKKNISKSIKGIGAIFGGIAIGKNIKDFVQTAARTETLGVAMNSVAKASGYAIDAINEHKKAVMDMGIAEQEAMKIITRFMQAQLDTAKAAKLARVAQDAAVIAGMNSSEAAEQMTEAIAKQRPELLVAFGMTKNLNNILNDYAVTVGKTAKELTEAERKQAILNYILQEGEKIAGTYEATMGVVGKQIGSLPRYWQTLQNAIATPLALPGLGVAVQAITNALKSAIAWAEANATTLKYWGQVISGVVSGVVNAISWATQTLAQNWGMIKAVTIALLSYATASRIVTVATKVLGAVTTAWRVVNLALRGELMTNIPVLTTLSAAIGTYRLQMALAPAATNIFTGALLRLRTALYAVHVALGPVGWAILGITALLGGGMALWSKYSNSVIKANQSLGQSIDVANIQAKTLQSTNNALKNISNNAGKAGKGQKKLADGIKKAQKAAKGSLASFDEINKLQDNMADAADDIEKAASAGGAGSVPDISASVPSIPDVSGGIPDLGIGIGGMLEDIELAKPTLRGFWEWIKEGASNIWDKVKQKWSQFIEWVKGWEIWEVIREKWNKLKEWAARLWDGVKTAWSEFTDWVSKKFSTIWDTIKRTWSSFKDWAAKIWDGVKTAWGKFTDWVANIWERLRQTASRIWNAIKDTVVKAFESARTSVTNIWNIIKTFLVNLWNGLIGSARNIFSKVWSTITNVFSNVKSWFGSTFGGAWDRIRDIFSISKVRTVFSNVWNTIKNIFNVVPNWFNNTFSKAWQNVKNVFSSGGKVFDGIKDGISGTFKTIVNRLIDGINRIIRTPFNAINRMLNRIREVSVMGLKPFAALWSRNPISVPQIPKLAKGGITNGPMLALIGDNPGGREVVSPLDDLLGMIEKTVNKAIRNNATTSDRPIEVNLIIDGNKLGRVVINSINSLQRQSGKTLLEV